MKFDLQWAEGFSYVGFSINDDRNPRWLKYCSWTQADCIPFFFSKSPICKSNSKLKPEHSIDSKSWSIFDKYLCGYKLATAESVKHQYRLKNFLSRQMVFFANGRVPSSSKIQFYSSPALSCLKIQHCIFQPLRILSDFCCHH